MEDYYFDVSNGRAQARTLGPVRDFFSRLRSQSMEDGQFCGRSESEFHPRRQHPDLPLEGWQPPVPIENNDNLTEIVFPREIKGRLIRKIVAQNPFAPIEVLDMLAMDGSTAVQAEVASNPNTSHSTLTLLARVGGRRVKRALAANPCAPTRAFNLLAVDSRNYIRLALAQNPSTPPSLLNYLARDRNVRVRIKVAANASAPVGTLMRLSVDKSSKVRMCATENPALPKELLSDSSSKSLPIWEEIISTIHLVVQFSSSAIALTRNWFARVANSLWGNSQKSPIDDVQKSPMARASVALPLDVKVSEKHSSSSEVLLFQDLANSQNPRIRRWIADHRYAPTSVLDALSLDTVAKVRVAVARNSETPPLILSRLSSDPNSRVRQAVAFSPNCDVNVLTQLQSDQKWRVRRAAGASLYFQKVATFADTQP